MKHSICIIDDAIPTTGFPEFIDGTKRLDQSILKYLTINEPDWDEEALKNLIIEINDNQSDWTLSAFTNPQFYFSHYENEIFSPDIIIFDWEYGGSTDSSEELLMKLLEKTYAIVNVYTHADNEGQVTAIIESDSFESYVNRLRLIKKDEDDSVAKLVDYTLERFNSNFSFRYGQELKNNALSALDEVLIQISKLSIDDFVGIFGYRKSGGFSISTNDLTAIISEKFKHELLSKKFSKSEEKTTGQVDFNDEDLVRKIWAYRLYYCPQDNIVRKGDIISRVNGDDDERYLVLSSDCHLNMFWKKNFGYVSMVPIYKLSASSIKIKEKFSAVKSAHLNSLKISSLTNSSLEGVTILPGIKDAQGNFDDYLLNSKEVFTVRRKLPNIGNIEQKKYVLPLSYSNFKGYMGKDRLKISEPFLSPLIQFIVDNFTGYGCPDFPEYLTKNLKDKFNESRK